MATGTITVRLHMAWWWSLYVSGLWLCAWTFDLEPDWERVEAVIHKALKVTRV